MKGQQKSPYIRKRNTEQSALISIHTDMKFTPLDLVPLDVNPDSFFRYLVNSGWVAGIVQHKCTLHISKDDTIEIYHEILLMIHERLKRIVEIYEDKGLQSALVYVKTIATIQSNPISESTVYRHYILNNRVKTTYLDNQMMSDIDECYNPDIDPIYHLSNYMPEYDNEID